MQMLASECEYSEQGSVFRGFVPLIMGTRLDVLLCGAPAGLCESLWKRICDEAVALDGLMNRFDPESEVSRINASGASTMSDAMSSIIATCERYRKSTCGLFDLGRGTVDWGSALIYDDGVERDHKPVAIDLGGGNLDFGGFGKGFLLSEITNMIREAGIASAYIDFGGSSIMAIGHHPYGDCWKVGVTDPYTGACIRQLELVDMAMSTSGNQPGYEGHIVDPRDGSPVRGRKIVTVLAGDPLVAEVVSTASMIANEKELDFIKQNSDIAKIICS